MIGPFKIIRSIFNHAVKLTTGFLHKMDLSENKNEIFFQNPTKNDHFNQTYPIKIYLMVILAKFFSSKGKQ
jgi:hypothetical protein